MRDGGVAPPSEREGDGGLTKEEEKERAGGERLVAPTGGA
jgi:hypothetical protein